MGERTLEDYGRAAVALPGFEYRPRMRKRSRALRRLGGGLGDWTLWSTVEAHNIVHAAAGASSYLPDPTRLHAVDIDDPATAGALEPLLGADLVIWDNREGLRGLHVLWPDGDHFFARCETKGRGLVLAAEYRGRWDGGAS